VSEKTSRAKSLSVEDRQDMILEAITPLLVKHGHAVTTRQIAECAGIAEGTIFRAFGSKDELIRAAVDRRLDPETFRAQLRAVDVGLPLEERVGAIVALMRERFTTVFSLMSALGRMGQPPHPDVRREYAEIIGAALAPDLGRLNVPAERAARVIRMITLAATVPHLNDGTDFGTAEIASLILYGIAGVSAVDTAPAPVPEPAR
jgi:AcrR family transcriptional regulator